ncbi:hypothetical protein M422DRAFT_186659 [Sphaerobolus stellatus SS14]|uniref:Major facilitator superfamily (MFS) profile domain-containing protein n=1 Tax=Sphaerobolus stellatus (strain SS14) TaxID=990650 RepID=A0A0C9V054_SPHS4|nr:hypothetical protein M422DRAFT_186659 [Sphaerobolus stellatus SS14]
MSTPVNSPPSQGDKGKLSRKSSILKDVDVSSTSSSQDLATPRPTPKFTDVLFRRHKLQPLDLDAVATEVSVYDDPVLAPHYQPTPEYENLHRFDPSARWTFREEKALVRKIDWRIMLWAADLGLTTDDFNNGNSLFRIAFLCAELPSQLVSKRLGPDRWIPIQMCLWSIVTLGQFWLNGKQSFSVCRFLLGFIQGGFIPDLILYLSYFYKKTELPLHFAYLWGSSNITTIVASFLAFGILHMRGIQVKEGWRWLFLIEGLITLTVGIATFFMMPASPTQTKTWFRPKGWFTEREEVIMVNRILRDDPTKGDMHNREGLSIKRLFQAALDYDLYPLYILGFTFGIPSTPPANYLTLSLRKLSFTTFQSNLLTIPKTVAGLVALLGITILSELVDSRSWIALAEDLWVLPCLIALYVLPANPDPWKYFAVSSVLLSYPYTHAILAWCSRNAGSVAGRTVNASLYNIFVQASGVVASYIYRSDDAPRYLRGNRDLIVICCLNIFVLYPGTWLYYKWRNAEREKKWSKLSSEEKSKYLATTKDVGNRRLDFRFAY